MRRNLLLFTLTMTVFLACSHKTQPNGSDMKPNAPLENTRWKLRSLPGMASLPALEKDVWIQFVLNSTNFRGNAGCNNMTGSFRTEAGNRIKIGPVAMTRMMCPESNMNVEQRMTRAVNEADNYRISGDNLELRKGNEVLASFEALYLK